MRPGHGLESRSAVSDGSLPPHLPLRALRVRRALGRAATERHCDPAPEQPYQILTLLLCRPGEVVTREEVRQALWPGDTFVDFDTGVNSAIKRLRDALHDSADKPRFVETVPRRGYRFIAPVEAPAIPAAIRPATTIAAAGLRRDRDGLFRSSRPGQPVLRRAARRHSSSAAAADPSRERGSGAGDTLACRAAVPEPDGRRGAGLLRGRRDRRAHHRSRADPRTEGDLAHLRHAVREARQVPATDRPRARRRRRGGRARSPGPATGCG